MSQDTLTLQQLHEQRTGPIWVMNTGSRAAQGGGDVFIVVQSSNGVSNQPPLMVPKAKAAFELTASAPRKQIIASSHFMSAIEKGVIVAISEDFAHRINSSADGRAELARLRDRAAAVRTAAAALRESALEGQDPLPKPENADLTPDASSLFKIDTDFNPGGQPDAVEAIPAVDSLTPRFTSMVSYINTLPPEQGRKVLRDYGPLSYVELQYVVKTCTVDAIRVRAAKVLREWDEEED